MIPAAFLLVVMLCLGLVLCALGSAADDEDAILAGLLIVWMPVLGFVVLGVMRQ